MNNAMANIQAGNINYNNAAAVGMTVPQAQQYYNNLVAQQQAQAQAEAEALAWERQQQEIANAQKWQQINNDTLQTQYNINKPYYKEGNNTGKTYNLVETLEIMNNATSAEQEQAIVDTLLDAGEITPDVWNAIYNMNPNWQ
jgi:polyhydroxyalkanoate synthesis regulator phasin